MADEPEQLGLESRDQETAAQDKALDQLTDHVRHLSSKATCTDSLTWLLFCRLKRKSLTLTKSEML